MMAKAVSYLSTCPLACFLVCSWCSMNVDFEEQNGVGGSECSQEAPEGIIKAVLCLSGHGCMRARGQPIKGINQLPSFPLPTFSSTTLFCLTRFFL